MFFSPLEDMVDSSIISKNENNVHIDSQNPSTSKLVTKHPNHTI